MIIQHWFAVFSIHVMILGENVQPPVTPLTTRSSPHHYRIRMLHYFHCLMRQVVADITWLSQLSIFLYSNLKLSTIFSGWSQAFYMLFMCDKVSWQKDMMAVLNPSADSIFIICSWYPCKDFGITFFQSTCIEG